MHLHYFRLSFTKVNPNTVCFRYLNILIPIIAPDLIFVHNGTFTTSVILCCTNTFGRLVYEPLRGLGTLRVQLRRPLGALLTLENF